MPDLMPDINNFFITDVISEDLSMKDSAAEKGSISGIAAYYNKYNRNERCYLPGCFDKSLKDNKIAMLWNHYSSNVVGKWNDVYSEGAKIKANGQLIVSTSQGNDIYELVKHDAVSGLSIGWIPYYNKNGSHKGLEETDRGLLVKEAELREISVVSFPAEVRAQIRRVNNLGDLGTIRELEKYLIRQIGLSKTDAKTLISRCMQICNEQRAGGSADISAGCHVENEKISGMAAVSKALQEIFY